METIVIIMATLILAAYFAFPVYIIIKSIITGRHYHYISDHEICTNEALFKKYDSELLFFRNFNTFAPILSAPLQKELDLSYFIIGISIIVIGNIIAIFSKWLYKRIDTRHLKDLQDLLAP